MLISSNLANTIAKHRIVAVVVVVTELLSPSHKDIVPRT